jgi:hypothetical protein
MMTINQLLDLVADIAGKRQLAPRRRRLIRYFR